MQRRFTPIELLVVTAMLLPALNRAEQKAIATQCRKNLKNFFRRTCSYSDGNHEDNDSATADDAPWKPALRHDGCMERQTLASGPAPKERHPNKKGRHSPPSCPAEHRTPIAAFACKYRGISLGGSRHHASIAAHNDSTDSTKAQVYCTPENVKQPSAPLPYHGRSA